jgi:putative ABC transport system substrate-binding protein
VAKDATSTIPIVGLDLESDPVSNGFVASLARPGGNLTGVFLDLPEIGGKQLQLLKETVPGLARVCVLWEPEVGEPQLRATEGAARLAGLTLNAVGIRRGGGTRRGSGPRRGGTCPSDGGSHISAHLKQPAPDR